MIQFIHPKLHALFDWDTIQEFEDQKIFDFKVNSITEEQIREYKDYINWNALNDRDFSIEFLREFIEELSMQNFPNKNYTREFREKRNEF